MLNDLRTPLSPGSTWEPDGTTDEIWQEQPFLHRFVVTLIWSPDLFHPVSGQTLHPGMKNVPPCLFNIIKKQPTGADGKKILPECTNISKYLYMNSQQQSKKLLKMISSSVFLGGNSANMTTMYSEHSQELKTSRLHRQFCVAACLIRNLFENICIFDFTK